MKRTSTRIAVAAVALAVSTASLAGGRRHGDEAYYVWAKVVDVQPIVRVVQVTTPNRVCWDETVRHVQHGGDGGHSKTPTVLGGIIGGVIGNQFGSGRGRDAATVAGVLLGASVGSDYSRQHRRPAASRVYYTTEQRCEIENVVHEEERIDGYRVTYRYQGRTFTTRSPVDPGDSIRVRVQVEPVAYNAVDTARY